jgi:PPM family protein phosphatase
MFSLKSFGTTNVGLRRMNNEDAFLLEPDVGLFALADGMGGADAGEVASDIFVKTAGEIFRHSFIAHDVAIRDRVQEVFRQANDRMIKYIVENSIGKGMGCTAELLCFTETHYIIGHVGDSRIYLLRDEVLRQVTKDHSLVQQQIDEGIITSAEAKKHPLKNIVLRALGTDSNLSLDLVRGRVFPKDIYLLCSDGLTDMVSDTNIQNILSSSEALNDKAYRLIESALAEGGKDNVTVVLCQLD